VPPSGAPLPAASPSAVPPSPPPSSSAPLPVAPVVPAPAGSGENAAQQPIPPPGAALRFAPPRFYPLPAYALPPPQKHWYGWQTLIGLSISHSLAGVGTALLASGSEGFGVALIVVGSTGHAFTGPIVHWAHGHVARGFASLGITLGVPSSIIGIVIATGYAAEPNCRGDFCGLETVAIGFVSGWVASYLAPAVDVAALSYDELPVADNKKPLPKAGWRPVITGVVPLLGQGRTGLALAGQF
jgi:hypothetical protein